MEVEKKNLICFIKEKDELINCLFLLYKMKMYFNGMSCFPPSSPPLWPPSTPFYETISLLLPPTQLKLRDSLLNRRKRIINRCKNCQATNFLNYCAKIRSPLPNVSSVINIPQKN